MPSDVVAPISTGSCLRGGRLGLILPTFPQRADGLYNAGELAAMCQGAEEAGASALWACDHLFWHGPSLECLAAVTVAALATEHAFVGPCVLQLPLRQPAAVAKQAASLQHLSKGRLVLGLGVGTHAGEYDAAGVAFVDRGRRLDEGIDALHRAWGRTAAETDPSDHYRQRPAGDTVPIWVGGSSEAALRRAAMKGDGWIPLFVGPEEYAAALGRLDKETDRAGRSPAQIARAVVVFVSLGPAPVETGLAWMSSLYGLPAHAFARHLVAGDARACAAVVAQYLEAGAEHVAVFVTDDDPLVQFEDLAGELAGLRDDPDRVPGSSVPPTP